jgi:hypothetical protein
VPCLHKVGKRTFSLLWKGLIAHPIRKETRFSTLLNIARAERPQAPPDRQAMLTKPPARLFYDATPGGGLCIMLRAVFRFRAQHDWTFASLQERMLNAAQENDKVDVVDVCALARRKGRLECDDQERKPWRPLLSSHYATARLSPLFSASPSSLSLTSPSSLNHLLPPSPRATGAGVDPALRGGRQASRRCQAHIPSQRGLRPRGSSPFTCVLTRPNVGFASDVSLHLICLPRGQVGALHPYPSLPPSPPPPLSRISRIFSVRPSVRLSV